MALVVRGCVDGERRTGQGVEVGSVLARSLSARERMVRLPSSQMTEVATVATSGFAVGIRT